MVVREGQRAFADASIPPHHAAGGEVEAGEDRVVEPVEIAVDEYHATVVVLHIPGEVDLARANLAAVGGKLEQHSAGAVVRRVKHAILVEDGRRDIRGIVGDARVAEHRLAVRGPYADGGGVGHRHHRANALHVPDDRRGVAGSVAEALAGPDGPPRHLVERNEGRVAAPRRYDDVVAVDEGGLAEQPLDVASVEVAEDVALPDRRPVLGLEAGEVAILGEHVHAIAIHGRRAARAAAAVAVTGRAERLRPEAAAVRPAQHVHDALAAVRALDEDAVRRDRHRAVALAEG